MPGRPVREEVLLRAVAVTAAALAATWAAMITLTLCMVVVWVTGPRSWISIGVFAVFVVTCVAAATLTARAARSPLGDG